MIDFSPERILLLEIKNVIKTRLEELGYNLAENPEQSASDAVYVNIAYDFESFDSETNLVSVYIEGESEAMPVEMGNPYLITKNLEVSIVVSSIEPNIAHEIAALIKQKFDLSNIIQINYEGINFGYADVSVSSLEQVQPNFPTSSKVSKYWWKVGLDISFLVDFSAGGGL